MNTILLVFAAILPAVLLCHYVYKKDRLEKEPMWLLLLLLFSGVLSCGPAAVIEKFLGGGINGIFEWLLSLGVHWDILYMPYYAVNYFIGVALVEEGVKWIVLVFWTKGEKNFNCLFDGLIYAVFVSLGFAALENVLYVVKYGWMNALMRGLLSVPGHMFFAVMMGYYYSRWIILKGAADGEKELIDLGVVEKREYPELNYKDPRLKSLLVPILFHGTYNFCCSMNSWEFTVIFYVFVIYMYFHCFGKINEMSMQDTPTGKKMAKILLDKYPELYDKVVNR